MRYQQSGSTPQQGSQQGKPGQMSQGSEAKVWPFKPFEYPPETGQPEFTLESLREEQARRTKRGRQQG